MIDGVSLIIAPRSDTCIFHVMRFPWDAAGAPKAGIGATDAALITDWPGLQFDNTRDYIMWGFGAASDQLLDNVLKMSGPQLHRLVRQRTTNRRTDLQKVVGHRRRCRCRRRSRRFPCPGQG